MKRPDISIVLLTWNRKRYLEKGLPSLFASLSTNVTHEIILMDNASSDGTCEELQKYAHRPDVKVIVNGQNLHFKGYNKLFGLARGKIIVELDDDVIEFPPLFDETFIKAFEKFPDFGYLSLDTVVNELTDGNRGTQFRDISRDGLTIAEGESRGYCAAFKRKDYHLIRPFTFFFPFSLAHPQDYVISGLIKRVLRKRAGVIVGVKCLHAFGPRYSKIFNREHFDSVKIAALG